MVSEWTDSVLVPANYVTMQRILGATFIFINLFVIIKEMMKRLRDKPKFKSKSWKWLSMLSIIGGLVHSLSWIMHYSDRICIVLYPLTDYVGKALPICVGLYQLSRLYQCFADGTVPGGYSIWLFYVMSIFGILNVLAFIPVIVWNERFMDCGWTDNHQFHMEFAAWSQEEWAIWDTMALTLYLIWDITTLLLLVIKLHSVTAKSRMLIQSEELVLGIRRNMMRIVILTIFYMLMTAAYTVSNFWGYYYKEATIWDWCISAGLWLLSSTTMSYAVFLMEPHNSREYGLFLKRLIGLKLHFCCCCYRGDVVKQRDHFLPKHDLEVSLIAPKTEMITNFTITGTAFNDFSLNKSPSTKYQAPYVSPIVTPNKRVEIVTEGDVVNAPLLRIPENLSRNDFLFESDAQKKEEFSSGFSFGVYLEYWRRNRRNSVLPKYFSLREELTMNRHATIANEQYDVLLRQCRELRAKYCLIAKNIGVMNKICGIEPGSEMTLEHMIAIKVYTDFTAHQAIFKQHCRRLYREETIESVIKRNREIAHWSRLLRECIMFYGETMEPSDVVYCGLNARLIFRSLHQRFECPLSTTKQPTVAMHFAEKGNGIVLTLKRSNAKTRYFDVTPFTAHKHEDERLFSGSTLKIIDISLGLKSLKRYINMLRMLEQIANGHFVDFGERTAELLVSFLRRVVAQSVMDVLREYMVSNALGGYLDEEEYDTDAILVDIENVGESNIIDALKDASNGILKLIKETRGMFRGHGRSTNVHEPFTVSSCTGAQQKVNFCVPFFQR